MLIDIHFFFLALSRSVKLLFLPESSTKLDLILSHFYFLAMSLIKDRLENDMLTFEFRLYVSLHGIWGVDMLCFILSVIVIHLDRELMFAASFKGDS